MLNNLPSAGASLGTPLCLFCSTGFLIGFKRQAKAAFHRKRVLATVIFLSCMIGTLLAVFLIKTGGTIVAILCIVSGVAWPNIIGSRSTHVDSMRFYRIFVSMPRHASYHPLCFGRSRSLNFALWFGTLRREYAFS